MLKGRLIELRPARESDLDAMYAAHVNIADRGAYFPLGVRSESKFRRDFADNGFWEREEGTLLMITSDGEMAASSSSSTS
jgi:[ribosomal protein S5]-alanine N-acetyltransferase